MKRSGTCIAGIAALGLVLVGATAASKAAVSNHQADIMASPRPNIAYAILKTIVARKIGEFGGMVLASNNAAAPETVIRIANFTFAPATLTVHVGSSVTWKNEDDMVHVVKEQNGAFTSDALDTGDSFSHTFSQVGTVDYFCAIHPHMTGRIVVEP
jgi:plastocyanin